VVVTTTVSYTIAPNNPDPKDKSLIHIDCIPDDDLFEYINKLYYFVEEGIYRYVEYGSDQPNKDPNNPGPYDGFWINFNTKEYYYYIADSNSTPMPIVYNWEHDIGYITGQDCKYIYMKQKKNKVTAIFEEEQAKMI
ncbi:MAG: hypothetical protein IJP28_04045, partial [Erysipelotrichales bacterium]|nr:hypothetical protein [Erysipelotrichales bacterium]